jgi:hypothetical protein
MAWQTVIATIGLLMACFIPVAALGWETASSDPPTAHTEGEISFVTPSDFTNVDEDPQRIGEAVQGVEAALTLTESAAYAPAGGSIDGTIIVGVSDGGAIGEGPRLLSSAASTRLEASEGPSIVRLRPDYIAVRISGHLAIEGTATRSVTIYSIPMTGATVHVVCLAGFGRARAALMKACEHSVDSLRIPRHYGRPFQLTAWATYRRQLREAIGPYAEKLLARRGQLRVAATAAGERHAAERLASLCLETSNSVSGLPYDPIARPAQRELSRSFADCAHAYGTLAEAIANDDERGYQSAKRHISSDEALAQEALRTIMAPR